MARGISLNELPTRLRKEIEPKGKVISKKLIALGKVLQVLERMHKQDALWVLRKVIRELGGIRSREVSVSAGKQRGRT
jgi:hypothetical protein